jgi:glycosyltransferase involved in cell wall biosynthesis
VTTAVVITTRNEADTIEYLVSALVRMGLPVYLVDDGSTDNTIARAVLGGARTVFQTGGGWGIGPSLMHGWKMALNDSQCDWVLQIDAGGSHQVEDYVVFAAQVRGGLTATPDMVIGSRFCGGANYLGGNGPWWRSFASQAAAIGCSFAHGSYYSDWTSGYRLFSRSVLEYLLKQHYVARMHGWQIETLAYASARGFSAVEVPITYIAGRSSFSRAVASEALRVWWKVLWDIGWTNSRLDEDI